MKKIQQNKLPTRTSLRPRTTSSSQNASKASAVCRNSGTSLYNAFWELISPDMILHTLLMLAQGYYLGIPK
jgi:hypothetical protein